MVLSFKFEFLNELQLGRESNGNISDGGFVSIQKNQNGKHVILHIKSIEKYATWFQAFVKFLNLAVQGLRGASLFRVVRL